MAIWLTKNTDSGKTLLAWWNSLPEDRGARAELRRAHSVTAVVLSEPYQRLHRRLVLRGWPKHTKSHENDYLAAAVGVLAHVRTDDPRGVAECMSAAYASDEQGGVSELRFKRLLESPDTDALFIGLRRALPLINFRINVLALANDVVHWGDDVRKRWAYDYVWPEKA